MKEYLRALILDAYKWGHAFSKLNVANHWNGCIEIWLPPPTAHKKWTFGRMHEQLIKKDWLGNWVRKVRRKKQNLHHLLRWSMIRLMVEQRSFQVDSVCSWESKTKTGVSDITNSSYPPPPPTKEKRKGRKGTLKRVASTLKHEQMEWMAGAAMG